MPEGWVVLCRESWGLSRDLSWAWWRALTQSKWSTHVAFRAAVLRYAQRGLPFTSTARAELWAQLAPGHLLQMTEELTRLRLLLKRDAVHIEEALLRRLTAQGEWQ